MKHEAAETHVRHLNLPPSPQLPVMLCQTLPNVGGFPDINDFILEQELVNTLPELVLLLKLGEILERLLSQRAAPHGLQALFELFSDRAGQVKIKEVKHGGV